MIKSFILFLFLMVTLPCKDVIDPSPPGEIFIDNFGVASPDFEVLNKKKTEIPFVNLPRDMNESIRYFKYVSDTDKESDLNGCSKKLVELWNEYRAKRDHPEGFPAYWKQNDPFCWKIAEELAPKIFFDFRGKSGSTYYLDSIILKTTDFLIPKNSGGYVEYELKKDILLMMKKDLKIILMTDPKLFFKERGKAEFSLWSEHYKNVTSGNFPKKATYLLGIRFCFSDHNRVKLKVPDIGFQYFLIQV
jgi:hypothetical protein